MNKFIKLLLLAALSFVTANAQWLSGTIASGQTIIDSGGGTLASLQLIDTSGSANAVILYDLASTSTTNNITPAYTGRQYYSTNIVKSWTDSQGNTKTRTNTFLYSAPLAVTLQTNQANRLYTVTIPANGTVTIEPSTPLGYLFGISIKNAGALSYNARVISN